MHIVWACGIFLCYFQLHFHSSNSKLELRDASSILWCGIVPFAPHCTESSMLPLRLSCYLVWQYRLFMCLCAVQLSTTPLYTTPPTLHPTCCTPCTPCTLLALFNSQTSVCSLELLLQLLRLFGRLSVCSTLQQCYCTVYMLYPAYSYVLYIYAHLRGVLCI